MSRERPPPPPRAIPNQGEFNPHEERQRRRREELERLKSFSGPGFMGYLAATFSTGRLKRGPVMIRRGYEASILDELRDFFIQRGWRQAHCRPKPTHKERRRALRRALQSGVIRRLGRGRWGLVKVQPHA